MCKFHECKLKVGDASASAHHNPSDITLHIHTDTPDTDRNTNTSHGNDLCTIRQAKCKSHLSMAQRKREKAVGRAATAAMAARARMDGYSFPKIECVEPCVLSLSTPPSSSFWSTPRRPVVPAAPEEIEKI